MLELETALKQDSLKYDRWWYKKKDTHKKHVYQIQDSPPVHIIFIFSRPILLHMLN